MLTVQLSRAAYDRVLNFLSSAFVTGGNYTAQRILREEAFRIMRELGSYQMSDRQFLYSKAMPNGEND